MDFPALPNNLDIVYLGKLLGGVIRAYGGEAPYARTEAIRLRLPHIEPLNMLQVELLKRHRAGESDPRIAEEILLTINAIATALRNSG